LASTNHFNVRCQKVFLSFICNLTELFLDTPILPIICISQRAVWPSVSACFIHR